jgi:hypothetical protein
MITRRHFVVSSVAAAMVCPTDFSKLPGEFGKIERESGGAWALPYSIPYPERRPIIAAMNAFRCVARSRFSRRRQSSRALKMGRSGLIERFTSVETTSWRTRPSPRCIFPKVI